MAVKESRIGRLARKYLEASNSGESPKAIERMRSDFEMRVAERLSRLESQKKDLIYHLHELEELYESGKANEAYYQKTHTSIQKKIYGLEDEAKKLHGGLKNPASLVEGKKQLRLSKIHVLVVVEALLILTVVYIARQMARLLPANP